MVMILKMDGDVIEAPRIQRLELRESLRRHPSLRVRLTGNLKLPGQAHIELELDGLEAPFFGGSLTRARVRDGSVSLCAVGPSLGRDLVLQTRSFGGSAFKEPVNEMAGIDALLHGVDGQGRLGSLKASHLLQWRESDWRCLHRVAALADCIVQPSRTGPELALRRFDELPSFEVQPHELLNQRLELLGHRNPGVTVILGGLPSSASAEQPESAASNGASGFPAELRREDLPPHQIAMGFFESHLEGPDRASRIAAQSLGRALRYDAELLDPRPGAPALLTAPEGLAPPGPMLIVERQLRYLSRPVSAYRLVNRVRCILTDAFPFPKRQRRALTLVVGTVLDRRDPCRLAQLKVGLPWSTGSAGVWCSSLQNSIGPAGGSYWPPEVGEKVLVLFQPDVLAPPLVLGAIAHAGAKVSERIEDLNRFRGIWTNLFHVLQGPEALVLRWGKDGEIQLADGKLNMKHGAAKIQGPVTIEGSLEVR